MKTRSLCDYMIHLDLYKKSEILLNATKISLKIKKRKEKHIYK